MTASAEPGGQELTVIEGGAKRDAGVPFGHQPAPANPATRLALSDVELPPRLRAVLCETEIPNTDLAALDATGLFELGLRAFKSSLAHMAYAGYCWALAKEKAGGGRAWVDAQAAAAGIGKDYVYRAITVFDQVLRVPEQLVATVATNDYTKVLLLRKLDDDELTELAERGETQSGVKLEDIENLSVRELDKLLTRASHAERHWRQKAQELDATLRAAYEELDRRKTADAWQGDLPGSVRQAREDGAALGLLATDCVTQIEALFTAVISGVDLNHDEHRRAGELRSALGPLYVALRGISAQAVSLEQHMRELVPDYLPHSNDDLLLSDDERAAIVDKHRFLRLQLDRVPSRLFGVGREEQIRESRAKKRPKNRGRRNG